jgi:hypothetical protein
MPSKSQKQESPAKIAAQLKLKFIENIGSITKAQTEIHRVSGELAGLVRSQISSEQIKEVLDSLVAADITILLRALVETDIHGIKCVLGAVSGIPAGFVQAFNDHNAMNELFGAFEDHTCNTDDKQAFMKLGEFILAVYEAYASRIKSTHSVRAIECAMKLGVKPNLTVARKILSDDGFSVSYKVKALLVLKEQNGRDIETELERLEKTVVERLSTGRINHFSLIEEVIGVGVPVKNLLDAVMVAKEASLFIEFLKKYQECLPAAQEIVLTSGKIHDVVSFFRNFGKNCDQERFVKRITDLMIPDPTEIAKGILGIGKDENNQMHRMPHPLMFHPLMMCGPFAKW